MDIWQIVSIGIVGGILSLIVKKEKPEISMIIGIVTATIIFILIFSKLIAIFEAFMAISKSYDINTGFIKTVIKIIGISYLCEFTVNMLKDAGENAIATKVEICSKIIIMSMAIPIIATLIDTVTKVIN